MSADRVVTLRDIYEEQKDALNLEIVVESPADSAALLATDVHRPGMALMGFSENFQPGRIQVFGASEMAYLGTLSGEAQGTAMVRVLDLKPAAIFISSGRVAPPAVVRMVSDQGFPLICSSLPAVVLISELAKALERAFWPHTEVHGTLVDVYGVGLLFTGRSGIGKSECAMDLIERGHRLVADDLVALTRSGENVLIGRYSELLRHHLEIRGVGVVDVQALFGIRAIRMQKRVEVEVQLQEWDDSVDYERVGMDEHYTEILGMKIPRVALPLFPGKNITVISEVIALNYMLKTYGYDAAHVLNDRILGTLRAGGRLQNYLDHDRE